MQDLKHATDIFPVDFNDPFFKEKIRAINIAYIYNGFTGLWEASGNVQMRDHNTGGYQLFTGKDIPDIIQQIKSFIDNLK